MKILQIIDSLPTGGGARFVVSLAKELKKNGVNVDVLLFSGEESPFKSELKNAGIKVISLTIGRRWSILNIFKLRSYFKTYDIVHVNIFPGSYYTAIAKFLGKTKMPFVFTEHNSQNRRATHFLFKYVEKWMYKQYDSIVCLTKDVQDFVVGHLNVGTEKLEIITNGIDLSTVNLALPLSKTELGFTEGDRLILMCARFEVQKDHQTAIKSLQYLPENFHLLFAGEGSTMEGCKRICDDLGVAGKVHFLGNREDVFSLMKTVDYNLLSSNFEGLSLTALESLASGKPFIASDVSGLNFVKDAGVLFDVGNEKQLANVIVNLDKNRSEYEKVAFRCVSLSKHYTVEMMTEKYIKLYKQLLNQQKK